MELAVAVAALGLLTLGCVIRVSSEIIAYQGYAEWGWNLLPVSAIIELVAVTLFWLNMAVTLLRRPLVPVTVVRMADVQIMPATDRQAN